VDLNLNEFDLTKPSKVLPQPAGPCASWVELLRREGSGYNPVGESVAAAGVEEQDAELLRAIFNPHLCDRRDDKDAFMLPDPDASYVEKLRRLVTKEDAVRCKRRERFLGSEFAQANPGPLFPASWAPSFKIEDGVAPADELVGKARPELLEGEGAKALRERLAAAAAFDKSTEDGLRFRIYHVGDLELRTTQEYQGEEVVGAVYERAGLVERSVGAPAPRTEERIVKVTEYVEATGPALWNMYLVFETEGGSTLIMEKRGDGTVSYQENPADAVQRSSLAKVVRSMDRPAGLCVSDVRGHAQKQASRAEPGGASHSQCKHFVQAVYAWSAGKCQATSGFCRLETKTGTATKEESGESGKPGKSCRRRQLDKYLKFRATRRGA
jgi:hypothetical protein